VDSILGTVTIAEDAVEVNEAAVGTGGLTLLFVDACYSVMAMDRGAKSMLMD
jgi:hypothetical protein